MAHVDSGSVSQAIQICTQASEALTRTIQDLQSKYQAAGSGWKDAKYAELGSIVNECVQALSRPISDLGACQQTLRSVLQAIQDYEGINL